MSELINNPFPQVQNQSLSTSDQGALIKRADHVSQANTEKFQTEIKLPFLLHNERAMHELKKRELIRKQRQVATVEKSNTGTMTDTTQLPHLLPKVKRRLRSVEKTFERLLKKMLRKNKTRKKLGKKLL